MLTTLLAAALLTGTPADEYFPLVPGSRRTYEEKVDRMKATTVDEVGQPITAGGKTMVPVYTKDRDTIVATACYRSEPDGIYKVGDDPSKPLPKPAPILVFDGTRGHWEFTGNTSDSKNSPGLQVIGDAVPKGERTVLGKKVPVIEVRLITIVDAGLIHVRGEQLSIYAKGIGLVESTTKQKEGNKVITQTLRLVKMEEAKSTG